MSKNITLFGQDYSSVPAINVPLQGGGTARFIDEDDAGGGGGTATVAFTNSSNSAEFDIDMPLIDPTTGIARADGILLPAGETQTVTVPMGPSGCFAHMGAKSDWPESGTATGGVRYDNGDIYITGDGTLTLS